MEWQTIIEPLVLPENELLPGQGLRRRRETEIAEKLVEEANTAKGKKIGGGGGRFTGLGTGGIGESIWVV